MPRHDVVIYAPAAAGYYDAAEGVTTGGGAERQTVLLARALAGAGLRVAHVVYPVREPVLPHDGSLALLQRPRPTSHGTMRDFAVECRRQWAVLDAADGAVQVLRGAQGGLGLATLWARRRGRRVAFAAANDSDFGAGPFAGRADPRGWLYRAGLRAADAVVVQSRAQLALARDAGRPGADPVRIPSFVEPAEPTRQPGEAFLWVSRLTDYKQPLRYADLAAALPDARFWMLPTGVGDAASTALLEELRGRAAGLENLELVPQRPHAELQALIGRAVAMVNTSTFEGMPNTWLEGWARGVPALTLAFDPDGRIAEHGLGGSAGGSWEAFVGAARRLWDGRADRAVLGARVRAYVATVHGRDVEAAWQRLVAGLLTAGPGAP